MNVRVKQRIPTPSEFRMMLNIKTADGGVARYADAHDHWQEEVLGQLDEAIMAAAGVIERKESVVPSKLYWELPRSHGKSLTTAMVSMYPLLFAPRLTRQAVAAAAKQQAGIIREKFEDLKEVNPQLSLDIQEWRIRNPETKSELTILPADSSTAFGRTDSLLICEELVQWGERGQRLWGTLLSTSAKLKHSVVMVISNAGGGRDACWQWDVRENSRLVDDWLFERADGVIASWISEAKLQQQQRELPGPVYDQLWRNIWTSTIGDILYESDILRAIRQEGEIHERQPGCVFVGGLDMAVRRNHAAFVVFSLNLGSGHVQVAAIRYWRPQDFDISEVDYAVVERDILELHNKLYLRVIACDPAKAEYLRQRLRSDVVPTRAKL